LEPAFAAQQTSLEELEGFAWAPDRWAWIQGLVPGSATRSYFTCLQALNEGRFADCEGELEAWRGRWAGDERLPAMEARLALARFDAEPEATWEFIDRHYQLDGLVARRQGQDAGNLPTALDPAAITNERFGALSLERQRQTFEGWSQAALWRFDPAQLSLEEQGQWLSRLERLDAPAVRSVLLRLQEASPKAGLSGLRLSAQLPLDQLEAMLAKRPEWLADGKFVRELLRSYDLAAGLDREQPSEQRDNWLGRLEHISRRLPASQNARIAQILFLILRTEWSAGRLSEPRLLRYLGLGLAGELSSELLAQKNEQLGIDPDEQPAEIAGVGEPKGRSELLREMLLSVLAKRDDLGPYGELLEPDIGLRLLAEAHLLAGDTRVDFWRQQLKDDDFLLALEQRQELRFPADRLQRFDARAEVVLELELKNYGELYVNVYAIDAVGHYRQNLTALEPGLDLQGFLPSQSTRYRYEQGPFVRHRERFELAGLSQPGTYLVEFLAGEQALRVLVQKGALALEEAPCAAGTRCRIVDERGQPRPGAQLFLGNREFVADGSGELIVPFSEEDLTRSVVLAEGSVATLASLTTYAEDYQLEFAWHVEPEAEAGSQGLGLLLQPKLTLAEQAMPLELLQQASAEVTLERRDGVPIRKRYALGTLEKHGELRLSLPLPQGLIGVEVRLVGEVLKVGNSQPSPVSSQPRSLPWAQVQGSTRVWLPLLARDQSGYRLELRGRNGEPWPAQAVRLELLHRDYQRRLSVDLATDSQGRIALGQLPGIHSLRISLDEDHGLDFVLGGNARPWPAVVHAEAGKILTLPLPLGFGAEREVSLVERVPQGWGRVLSQQVEFGASELRIEGLEAGDYSLWLPALDLAVDLRIAGATEPGGSRRLEVLGGPPLGLRSATLDGGELLVELTGSDATTRLHVAASRYAPLTDWHGEFSARQPEEPRLWPLEWPRNEYLSGLSVDAETQYVLARRYARHYPGSLLERPGYLLAPWDRQVVENVFGVGGGGGGGRGGGNRSGARVKKSAGPTVSGYTSGPRQADLGFLPRGSVLLANLVPDADGRVRIPLAELGEGGWLRLLAISERGQASAELGLPEKPLLSRDRRVTASAAEAPARFEARQSQALVQGQPLPAVQESAARLRLLTDLVEVYDLLASRCGDAQFHELRFLLDWPSLAPEERLRQYDTHVCHEVHFFLRFKDPEFFEAIVRPYLANKGQMDFMDEWLLERDLRPYLAPARFQGLNQLERILLLERTGAAAAQVEELCRRYSEKYQLSAAGSKTLFESALEFGRAADGTPIGAVGLQAELPAVEESVLPNAERESSEDPDAHAGTGFFLGSGQSEDNASDSSESPFNADQFNNVIGVGGGKPGASKNALAERRRSKPLYRGPGETREWFESFWWRRAAPLGSPEFVAGEFWAAYARRLAGQPFLQIPLLPDAASASERWMALALLDLPFRTPSADSAPAQAAAPRPALLLRQELLASTPGANPGLLAFVSLHAAETDGNDRGEVPLEPQGLLAKTPYRQRLVLYNSSAEKIALEVALRLPAGALALDGLAGERRWPLTLEPLGSSRLEVPFYFPEAGQFLHRPGDVHRSEQSLVVLEDQTLRVSPLGAQVGPRSFAQLVDSGSPGELLEFLAEADLEALPLGLLVKRFDDPQLTAAVVDQLRQRLWFEPELWRAALLHRDSRVLGEFLAQDAEMCEWLAPGFQGTLLRLDTFTDLRLELTELAPLIPARAHPFGGQLHAITGEQLQTYRLVLEQMAHARVPSASHELCCCVQLLYQERIDAALERFALIERENLNERLQYDYLAASMALQRGDWPKARAFAEPQRQHPVPRWRLRFSELCNVLDRIEGRPVQAEEGQDPRLSAQQTQLAAAEPVLELEQRGGELWVQWSGVETLEWLLYPIDVELQFSRAPFADARAEGHVRLEPQQRGQIALQPTSGEQRLELPADLAQQACLVAVRAAGLERQLLWQPSRLSVETADNFGRLTVREASTRTPAAAVYVKVYARDQDGSVRFYKDGYTDWLGRFDYVSVTPKSDGRVERFAILVLDPERGAVVRELTPPAR
jgi:hypothetical protein